MTCHLLIALHPSRHLLRNARRKLRKSKTASFEWRKLSFGVQFSSPDSNSRIDREETKQQKREEGRPLPKEGKLFTAALEEARVTHAAKPGELSSEQKKVLH